MKNIESLYSEKYHNVRFSSYTKESAYEGVYYVLSKKEKDLKPLLLLQVCDLFGGNLNENLPAAYAIELFNYSGVVLQDVVNHYSPFDSKISDFPQLAPSGSIITGDQLIILCYKYLSLVPTNKLKELMKVFNSSVVKFVKGQHLSQDFQNHTTPLTFSEYIDIISLQSAELTGLSFKMGALLGGASENEQNILYEAGINFGLGLHLKKEYLRVFIQNDLTFTESPFLFYKALEIASPKEKSTLNEILSGNAQNPERLKELYKRLNLMEIMQQTIINYFEAGAAILNTCTADKQKIAATTETIRTFYSEKL